MINPTDAASSWARRVATLRAQLAKGRRGAASADPAEDALAMCETVIRELAGAQLTNDRLRKQLHTADAAWNQLFDRMPGACLVTDSTSAILKANRAASLLLNASPAHLKGRDFLVFSEDREAFRLLLNELGRNGCTEPRARLRLRPRERKPTLVQLSVVPAVGGDDAWLWNVTPVSDEAALSAEIAVSADHPLARLSGTA